MDVAYISPVVYPFVKGGVEKRIYEIGLRLAERGHNVTVYSRHWWNGPPKMEYERITLKKIGPAREIYAEGDRRSVTSAIEFAVRVLLTVSRQNHDILVTPVAPYFHVASTRIASTLQQTPLVVTWHEVWNNYWLRYMGQPGRIGKLIERIIPWLSHHAVTPSKMTADRLSQISRSKKEINVIPNGIDVDKIQNVSAAADSFTVLFAGRLIDDKNVDMVLDAFNRVGSNATLGIIGDGPMRSTLEAKTERLDCKSQVTFLGFLDSYKDVLAYMKGASVFVSPSFREGFGITLLEAMAADCTVITVDHMHNAGKEIVGEAGFVTDPSLDSITQALDKALSGDRPSKNPVSTAKHYDWEIITTKTENLYFDIVEGKSS